MNTNNALLDLFADGTRIWIENGVPYYCAKDVASLLGYKRPDNAISRHCKRAFRKPVVTEGGVQSMVFITEEDLTRLITRSQMPLALAMHDYLDLLSFYNAVSPNDSLPQFNPLLKAEAPVSCKDCFGHNYCRHFGCPYQEKTYPNNSSLRCSS